jgi:hypothetical protein
MCPGLEVIGDRQRRITGEVAMFTSFRVKNYRCFKDLAVEPLERVNLIAGKNNVGKSALLEALWLCCKYNEPAISDFLTRYRGLDESKLGNYLVSLFREFDENQTIDIFVAETDSQTHSVTLNMIPGKASAREETGTDRADPSHAQRVPGSPDYSASFKITYQRNKPGVTPETDTMVMHEGRITQSSGRNTSLKRVSFLGGRGSEDSEKLIEKFSEVVFLKESERVFEALRVLEPRLERLALVARNAQLLIHGDIGLRTLIPLPLLGEGMSRLLSILLGAASARKGLLLVDEIENGLHYSVMTKVWKAIGAAARTFDVQVFATTHSDECIRAAYNAFSDDDAFDFRFHRLDNIEGNISSVTYDRETLEFALENGWEVR